MKPKRMRINAADSHTDVVDALANRMHAIFVGLEEVPLEDRLERAASLTAVELTAAMSSAYTHFKGEVEQDRFCPEGVEVHGGPTVRNLTAWSDA